ncbi:dipeptide epimerase [Haloferax volcanii]|uniref:Mandelate racemase n=3 Tax=Haloferax volcanii TaxID=2246 RepID=A0A384KI61_HALVD|nr:dipeptide epimerase [Haloferax volcanii]ADE01790.1 dipeptide epimerase-like protein [Haloferax volcanii DS2]ELY35868.1 mandelate racemase [Haloferax volcanii DS2]MBS8121171.1 dipeptide epimerase [Haloferax volcanii]MBS8126181.1 dipeptide epimerase [Haloferax volcanii]MBS8130050.1 dipeptide epimerase [Haloferax volcanii]
MSKISSVRVESLDLPLKEPFEIALGTQYNAPNVIVFVETETDVVGLGEGSPDHYVTGETQGATLDTISKASELLVGRDVANYRAIIEDLHATFPSAVSSLFALETAIIDAYCREIDIPMAELFGGSPDVVETDMTIPIHTPDVAAKRAESAVQNGFETLKIKVGEDLETDIQRVRSVSEAAPNATITVDANQGWSVSEAIMFDQAMHDAGISLSLLEQPVVKSDIAGLASVRNRTRAPVGADEAVFTPEDAVRVIRNDAADVINIKLGKSGLLGAADIAAITRAAGRDLMVGCMLESSIGIHTSAHLVSGIGGFSHVDLDATRLLDDDVIDRESGPTITPSGPGHGITPNW